MMNKIINADCTSQLPEIPDKSIDMLLTDPPYGINYQSNHKSKETRLPKIKNDEEPYINFIQHIPRILKDNGCAFVFTRWDVQQVFIDELERCGLKVKNIVIWNKGSHGMGDLQKSFGSQYESIIFCANEKFEFQEGRPIDIIKANRVTPEKLIHPNEKPVELLEYLIRQCTKRGGVVLDCFMGSGATAIACMNTERNFIGYELDEHYHAVAHKRVSTHNPQISLF